MNANNKVELNRFFPVPRERVYAAWTDASEIKQWFGPANVQAYEVSADVRVGGQYSISSRHADGETWHAGGEYRELTPPSRVVFTWRWKDDPDWDGVTSIVTVDLVEKPGGTEMRFTHEGFPSGESCGNHEKGWTGTLEKLEKFLAV